MPPPNISAVPAASLVRQGIALRSAGRVAEAHAIFLRACTQDPRHAEAWHQRGNLLKAQGRSGEALSALREAARLAPESATIWLNLGAACLETGATEEAATAFRRGVTLEPHRPEAHNILGHVLLTLGRLGPAEAAFNAALRLRPGYAPAQDNLGRLHKLTGRSAEALGCFRDAMKADARPATHSNLLLAMNAVAGLTAEEICAEHLRWGALHAAPLAQPRPAWTWDGRRRLRIGYVSPDFMNHAVARFIEPVLAAHDRERFEIFAYSSTARPDATTMRLRSSCEHWREITRVSDDEVAARIREDGIDILIDLAGHTAGNRLLVFARRPAPVQLTWIGYPNTTGMKAMDGRLTDAICDPVAHSEAWHTEKLLRLPGPFLCYRAPDETPEVGPLPAERLGHVTFGCFNHASKFSTATLDLWAKVLAAVPGSKLRLKSAGLDDPDTTARLRREFERRGVAAGRIETDGRRLSVAAHQCLYHGIDIALDPTPYNGTTTTCEALWMGVPVVTPRGELHAGRVGASLLGHLGRPDWVAEDEAAYVAIARGLAGDLAALAESRAGLRKQMAASALCDAPGFTRGLEKLLLGLNPAELA